MNKKTFRRHFRIYLKNNHPAYIVDEEGNVYVFHRVTHSKTSGGRKNGRLKIIQSKDTKNPCILSNKKKEISKEGLAYLK